MSYDSILENQSSSKFALIRLEPALLFNKTDYTVIATDTSQTNNWHHVSYDFDFHISKLELNGSEISAVETINVTNYSTQVKINKKSIELFYEDTTENDHIYYFYLFYCTEFDRTYHSDPNSISSNRVEWLGRVKQAPQLSSSIENLLAGQLSFSVSGLQLINSGNHFNNYLQTNYSFYNKKIEMFHCLDKIENNRKVFVGQIDQVTINRDVVSFSIIDETIKLGRVADFGEKSVISSADFPASEGFSLYDSDLGKRVPFFFQDKTEYKTGGDTLEARYGINQRSYSTKSNPDLNAIREAIPVENNGSDISDQKFLLGKTGSWGFPSYTFRVTSGLAYQRALTLPSGTVTYEEIYFNIHADDQANLAKIKEHYVFEVRYGAQTRYSRCSSVSIVNGRIVFEGSNLQGNPSLTAAYLQTVQAEANAGNVEIVLSAVPFVVIQNTSAGFNMPIKGGVSQDVFTEYYITEETTADGDTLLYLKYYR